MVVRISTALLAVAAVTGCQEAGREPVGTQFHREAGSLSETDGFGAATRANAAVMSGERRATHGLARRFADEVTSTVTFAFNSAVLDARARAVLREQAGWIRQFPEVRFRVYGHTDLAGPDAYNRALGLRRAQAVVRHLGSLGVSPDRLEAVVSYGETRPLIVTEGRERRNRRTVTEVSGFVAAHSAALDGRYAQVIYRDYVQSAQPRTTLEAGTLSGQ